MNTVNISVIDHAIGCIKYLSNRLCKKPKCYIDRKDS